MIYFIAVDSAKNSATLLLLARGQCPRGGVHIRWDGPHDWIPEIIADKLREYFADRSNDFLFIEKHETFKGLRESLMQQGIRKIPLLPIPRFRVLDPKIGPQSEKEIGGHRQGLRISSHYVRDLAQLTRR